ncbi:MAG TPA: NADH-quinone oxidoreductase subunit L [Bacteroidetes bacterium]|nr:NADH-quinone oxidoreductase subunit L [Bacteroidota bacterium]
MLDYVWLVPLFPLLGVIFNTIFGWKLKEKVVGIIGSTTIGLSLLVSILLLLDLLKLPEHHKIFELTLFKWIAAGSFAAEIGFQIDPLSVIMMLVVTGVSFVIHIYSIGYMHGDRGFNRFFIFMNLFVFAMLLLVMANNFLLMFVGWEGVGLCSYLLIGFWYEDNNNADAGKKAFIVNRIGDFGFLLGIFLIFTTFGTIDFTDVFHKAAVNFHVGDGTMVAIALLLFIGAVGKSAQLPLYVWLPDAMAGPTPVSALIHAATMVTAGVYMIARTNVIYTLAPAALMVVAIVGALTAIYAATIGITQFDIKKVLAYSTISQIGYMILACGVGAYSAGIFHLMTHAFFKACLFLGAGSVMHAMSNNTDIRIMGGLRKYMPATFWTFLLATLAISGIPGFSGFFSKDEILWQSFSSSYGNFWLWILGAVAAGITAFYMFRLVFVTFYGKLRADEEIARHVHESPKTMTVSLWILAGLSVIGGFIGIPAIFGGGNRFEHFLEPVFEKSAAIRESAMAVHGYAVEQGHSLEWTLMGIVFAIVLLGIGLAYLMYIKKTDLPGLVSRRIKPVYQLVFNKYYVDEIYNALVVQPIKNVSDYLLWKFVDVKLIDGTVNGTGYLVRFAGRSLRTIQTGFVQNYALVFILGVVLLLLYVVFI